ncbi:hypothetical protein BJV82DRAFT_603191, partial [Fennellomyces sp. T-0311]
MTDDRLRLPMSTSFNVLLLAWSLGSSLSLTTKSLSSSFVLSSLTPLPLVSPPPSLEKPCLTTDSINRVVLVCSDLSSAGASKSPIGASRSTGMLEGGGSRLPIAFTITVTNVTVVLV